VGDYKSNKGLRCPEELPHEEVLAAAEPYLGQVVSEPVAWTPLSRYRTFFPENPAAAPIWDDPWQFQNFVFRP
jgi:homospermidine synthase